jgi:uncharacterized membrane protein YgdD (TMEM256/DUF423 family)
MNISISRIVSILCASSVLIGALRVAAVENQNSTHNLRIIRNIASMSASIAIGVACGALSAKISQVIMKGTDYSVIGSAPLIIASLVVLFPMRFFAVAHTEAYIWGEGGDRFMDMFVEATLADWLTCAYGMREYLMPLLC